MKDINVYPGSAGGWVYEVWTAARCIVVGFCESREAAYQEALIA